MSHPPNKKRKNQLEVDVSGSRGTPDGSAPPALRRLTTPDCMSSPVSHLRDLTRDLEEDGAKRRRAAQYLREWREGHLQERRLYLVLDLDETLVHSLRASVRQIGGKRHPDEEEQQQPPEQQQQQPPPPPSALSAADLASAAAYQRMDPKEEAGEA